MDVKRRWKSLNHKVEYLRLEVEEKDERIKEFEKEFMEMLSGIDVEDIDPNPKPEQQPQFQVKDTTQENTEELPGTEPVAGPEEIKKLWKSIAAACHPDKTNNDPHKTQLYKRASEAWKVGAFDELYKIAVELGIELPEASEESLVVLNGLSSDLEKKLKEMEMSVLWMWGTTTPEKRQGIIDIYLKSRGKKRK